VYAQLPTGYTVRAAKMNDADTVTNFLNICEIDENGEPDFGPGDLADDWAHLNLGERVALIEAPDGSFAGYMAIFSTGNVLHQADIYVHPDHTERGLGTYLVRLSEARAQSWIDEAPAGKKVVLWNPVNATNAQANKLLQNLGYHEMRHFWRMQASLTSEPAAPVLPDGFTIRPCREGLDERAIFEAGREAYRDHWNMGPTTFDEWMQGKYGERYDPSLWFQLLDGEEIAGIAVCKVFSEDMGLVADLCVRRPWRKRGFGGALLQHAFREFYHRGFRKVGLSVDSQNPTGATRLYERAGMSVTRNFVIYEKELRAGEPWED
jgi:mycothiol synthase